MVSGFRVLGRVLIRRTVAAARTAAFLARTQMNPLRPDFHTLFTFALLRLFNVRNGLDMGTRCISHWVTSLSRSSDNRRL
jgi:hypothetical protein